MDWQGRYEILGVYSPTLCPFLSSSHFFLPFLPFSPTCEVPHCPSPQSSVWRLQLSSYFSSLGRKHIFGYLEPRERVW